MISIVRLAALRLVGTLLALEAFFRVMVLPAYASLDSRWWHRFDAWLELAAVQLGAHCSALLGLALVLGPVAEWAASEDAGQADPAKLSASLRRLHHAPFWVGLLWGLEWGGSYLIHAWLQGLPLFGPVGLLALALSLGVPPLGYLVSVRLLRRVTRATSLLASTRQLGEPVKTWSLRTTVTLISLSMTLAPATYVTAIAISSLARRDPVESLLLNTVIFAVAIGSYALLVAWLFADAVGEPLREASGLLKRIVSKGAIDGRELLPVERADEIGRLSHLLNATLSRLARAEAGRDAVLRHVAELNVALERRVESRTSDLRAANAALEQEIAARKRMETELVQAQKLESVGRLASGVAHEINTPVQFVSDSVAFVREAFGGVQGALAAFRFGLEVEGTLDERRRARSEVARICAEVDLDYLETHVPRALERATEGLQRVANIVRSMKEFAHPDARDKANADLNRAVTNTIEIARNEYKYVADLEVELGELPPVLCHVGEINQVVLNLIVNAAHAIGDVVRGTDKKGLISVRTRFLGDAVEISVEDTGTGIPEAARPHVFEPSFTTKGLGKGTGQGLAIARSVVVDKHHGSICFQTETGRGTTFRVRIPVGQGAALAA